MLALLLILIFSGGLLGAPTYCVGCGRVAGAVCIGALHPAREASR